MVNALKSFLYFPLASYFRFFAAIRLRRWQPKIIVVTGSNGKTTLLHMLEAQIGSKAKYSHHANSAFGIPFDILGLHRITLQKTEWVGLFLRTPFTVFKPLPKEKLYIVEADADQPGEGKFLAEFLKPDIVLWVSTARTHSMNFEHLVKENKFSTVEDAIAFEYGWFCVHCKSLLVIDGDAKGMKQQLERTKATVKAFEKARMLKHYSVDKHGTHFTMANKRISIPFLLPREVYLSIAMCELAVATLNVPFDESFKHFSLPPGRGSLFAGIRNTTIIDSCYNANLASMTAILEMYANFPSDNKWAIIGDMLEQGKGEAEEHKKLALVLAELDLDRLIFLGPRVIKNTLPEYEQIRKKKIVVNAFENPKETLDSILNTMQGGESMLFKGSRFMEGIIEHLLADKHDVTKLARREKVWEIRRKQWGF